MAAARASEPEESMPAPVARAEEQARYSGLTCNGSLGSAYLHTPITARNAWFDGELFQLTACRQLGMEQHTEVCAACGLLRGGTVTRFCRAPGMAGQQTVVHHAVCRALRELVQEHWHTGEGRELRALCRRGRCRCEQAHGLAGTARRLPPHSSV